MKAQKFGKCLIIGFLTINISSQSISAQKTGTTQSSSPSTLTNSQLGNYRNEKADQFIALETQKRQVINSDLQATVVELLELFHDAKQSHWNIRGPLYFPLHEALQEYSDLYLKYADLLAERQLQIGNPADGRTDVIDLFPK